ncbi:DUF4129 domain-containing protein [Micromonospora craniellae]|uniref:DUF4129 domain-containing protein n=1 Tax=Micromonospora craniellae TaxID=2294034 RepID=UPI00168BF3FC|nr:DUF4129 domain-containing protein [Micromonospora craniellae]QOC93550.1 DUF4129 domain-containing protein [Micromonospora craniellae]
MSFSRWWTEATAALGDHVPLPLATLSLVLVTALVAVGWYAWPSWVPRRIPRLRRRTRSRPERTETVREAPAPAVVDVPPVAVLDLADRLSADGRYAEAVRERLRAMLHELTDRRVVGIRPGMTVAEVVTAASTNRPPVGPPLSAAAAIFSELWYAQRGATVDHDHRMREHAARLRHLLAADGQAPPPVAATTRPTDPTGGSGPAHEPGPVDAPGPADGPGPTSKETTW